MLWFAGPLPLYSQLLCSELPISEEELEEGCGTPLVAFVFQYQGAMSTTVV